jgi:hypothetical protein
MARVSASRSGSAARGSGRRAGRMSAAELAPRPHGSGHQAGHQRAGKGRHMDGHVRRLPVHAQVLLFGSGVVAGDGLVGHTATLVAGRLAGRQRTDGHDGMPGRAGSPVR